MTARTPNRFLSVFFCAIGVSLAVPVSANLYLIEALYNAPSSGTAFVTGIYDDTGYTGIGTEAFNFIEANFEFSSGGSLLHDTSHTVFDMFGVLFVNGTPTDLINHNNTEANGKSKLIFNSAEAPGYPGALGIYMADNSSAMLVEGFWITNHQGAQAHNLVSFSAPTAIPLPAALPLLGSVIGLLGLLSWRNGTRSVCSINR